MVDKQIRGLSLVNGSASGLEYRKPRHPAQDPHRQKHTPVGIEDPHTRLLEIKLVPDPEAIIEGFHTELSALTEILKGLRALIHPFLCECT